MLGITQLLQAAVSLNEQQVIKSLQRLAKNQVNASGLARIVREQLTLITRGQFPGLKWLVRLLDESAQAAGLRFTSDLLMMRKSLHTLDGVLTELGATDKQIDCTLLMSFISHFLAEWPRRWIVPPISRDFVTHLSNVDLAQLTLGLPITLSRICLSKSIELLGASIGSCRLNESAVVGSVRTKELT